MRHDLKTGETVVLVDGLRFANGVALSKNKDFVAYCETVMLRYRAAQVPCCSGAELF